MDALGSYFAPLLLISGVGLIILSTSARFLSVKAEIQKFTPKECKMEKEKVRLELKRAHLFHRALVGLYLSIGFFSSSALFGTLVRDFPKLADFILESFTIAGVVCTVFATSQLIAESFLALTIVKNHTENK
jgi:hypothetical protein